ncbi:MAG: histidinol dehydrogenase, partial [Solirubrobacterales bacterium]
MKLKRLEWSGTNPRGLAADLRALAPQESITAGVREILERVRAGGDAAVREQAERFGEALPDALRVDPEAVAAAPGLLEPHVREALRLAAANIEAVARAEMDGLSRPALADLPHGQRVEVRSEPVGAAGIYAPGGKAPYPSSVLMCCIPARVAGVQRIALASPPGAGGRPQAPTLAAAAIAGVEEVYAVGGAQAIGALAFGTESIEAVDVVVGPGNRFVTEAKRLAFGHVGIDGLAGPSELLVVADSTADPRMIALDVSAQAEHGSDSPLVVVSPEAEVLDRVAELVAELVADRPSVTEAPLALVTAPGLEVALDLADAFAPEHLELAFAGADENAARSRIAGCVFVGAGGATAFGDYAAGSNHVLPTGGAARFGGPLGPEAFMRRNSVVSIGAEAATGLAPAVEAVAKAAGFPVHSESARARGG